MANVAVIRTGGKQYKVSEGEILEIERLTVAPGSSAEFSDVLLLVQDAKVHVGKPTVSGAKVVAEVVAHDRARKLSLSNTAAGKDITAPSAIVRLGLGSKSKRSKPANNRGLHHGT